MSHVRAEIDGYQLLEDDKGSWFILTPDGGKLRVKTGNKVKVYNEFLEDPEAACAMHCN